MIDVIQHYAIEARDVWVKEWPGQVVLAVSQIYWTVGIHECISEGEQGLRAYHATLVEQLGAIVELVGLENNSLSECVFSCMCYYTNRNCNCNCCKHLHMYSFLKNAL